jgi:hypothetical protein
VRNTRWNCGFQGFLRLISCRHVFKTSYPLNVTAHEPHVSRIHFPVL